MEVNRKEFLLATGTVLASAAVVPGELLAAGGGTPSAQMKGAVGQTFRVQGPRGGVDLVLSKYVDKSQVSTTTQFSLLFDAPGGELLPEGTYLTTTTGLGATPIFLVPAGTSKGHAYYRADFNLLRDTRKR